MNVILEPKNLLQKLEPNLGGSMFMLGCNGQIENFLARNDLTTIVDKLRLLPINF